MWHVVIAVAITALLSAVFVVTSDVLTYRELQRKLKRENRPLVDSDAFTARELQQKLQTERERRRESRF